MKKLLTLGLIICIVLISGNAFGQENTKKEERKGGVAVGGFDNARQDKAVKRSVEVPEEAPAEKAAEQMPAPAPAAVPPAELAKDQTAPQGNAYGKNKEGREGKEFGQSQSQKAKDKQKPKKQSKSKGKNK